MKKITLLFPLFFALLSGCSDKAAQQNQTPVIIDPKAIAESYVADEAKKNGDCEVFYAKQVSGFIGDPKTEAIALVYAAGNCKGGGNVAFNTIAVLEVKDGKGNLVSKAQLSPLEVSSVDSIAINSDGYVQLEVKSFAPDDPRCCPSVGKKIRFAFVNRNLVRLAEEVTASPKKEQQPNFMNNSRAPMPSNPEYSKETQFVRGKEFMGKHIKNGVTYFDSSLESCAAIEGLSMSLAMGIATKYSVPASSINFISASYGGKGSYCSVVVDTPVGPKTCLAPSVGLTKTGKYVAFTIATMSDGREMVLDNACR